MSSESKASKRTQKRSNSKTSAPSVGAPESQSTKPNVKGKKKKMPVPEQTYCVIRIRGAHGMRRTILRTLQLLNLHKVNHATLVRTNPSTLGMLQKAKDYIAFGPVSKEMIRKLLKKRAAIVGNQPLTDDYLRFVSEFESIDKLADALYEGRVRLKDIKNLKPVFRLHPPKGGYHGSIKKPIGAGGVLGNVGEKINDYLKKMI